MTYISCLCYIIIICGQLFMSICEHGCCRAVLSPTGLEFCTITKHLTSVADCVVRYNHFVERILKPSTVHHFIIGINGKRKDNLFISNLLLICDYSFVKQYLSSIISLVVIVAVNVSTQSCAFRSGKCTRIVSV